MVAIDPMCVFLFGLSLCGSEKTYVVVVRVELLDTDMKWEA